MILIVSFNARPIAHLAKKIGLEVAVVDFWGDQDLFPYAKKVFTIFKPSFKSYTAFSNPRENEEKLVELALNVISNEGIESILVGSGLDDRPDLWKKLNSVVKILGNSPDCIKKVRDLMGNLNKFKKQEIKLPHTISTRNISKIEKFAVTHDFPIIFKPKKTMGGVGIQLVRNEYELSEFLKKPSENLENYYVQEYIAGKNISTTMIGDKNTFKVLSINEQLIGTKSSGTNQPFKYCGNIIPFDCSPEIAQNIKESSLKISRMFKLMGIYGIDFVLQGTVPYFMEVNPRFPGTVELLEMVSEFNAVRLHLNALQGILPEKFKKFRGYAMKQILFAKKVQKTPNLEGIPNIFDIPYPNILLNPEDPICTVQLFDKSYENLIQKMNSLVYQIYLKAQ